MMLIVQLGYSNAILLPWKPETMAAVEALLTADKVNVGYSFDGPAKYEGHLDLRMRLVHERDPKLQEYWSAKQEEEGHVAPGAPVEPQAAADPDVAGDAGDEEGQG